jgi:hypothetical protein
MASDVVRAPDTGKPIRLQYHTPDELCPSTFSFVAPKHGQSLLSGQRLVKTEPAPAAVPSPVVNKDAEAMPPHLQAQSTVLPASHQVDGLRCDWDHHPFDGPAVTLPYHYDPMKGTYRTCGRYCSMGCAKAFALDSSNYHLKTFGPMLLCQLYGRMREGIQAALHWKTLQAYGGPYTIAQFRTRHVQGGTAQVVVPYELVMPMAYVLTRDPAEMRLTDSFQLVNDKGKVVRPRMYGGPVGPAAKKPRHGPPGRTVEVHPPTCMPRKHPSQAQLNKTQWTVKEVKVHAAMRRWQKAPPPKPGVVDAPIIIPTAVAPPLPPPPPPVDLAAEQLKRDVDALRKRKRVPVTSQRRLRDQLPKQTKTT